VVTIFDPVKNRVPIVVPVPNINLFAAAGRAADAAGQGRVPDYMTRSRCPA
jgi:hypothetical protein